MTWTDMAVIAVVWAAISVIVAVTAGKAISVAEHDRRAREKGSTVVCDGCGTRAAAETYCPDCADTRIATWGYR
jgi:predicted RNA-binding Zn-ribbon protein involved in translation (DUF1610 family)